MTKIVGWFMIIVGIFGTVILFSFLLAWPVMALWNGCLIPAFHEGAINPITWTQAWGLAILSGFLFKSSTTVNKND